MPFSYSDLADFHAASLSPALLLLLLLWLVLGHGRVTVSQELGRYEAN